MLDIQLSLSICGTSWILKSVDTQVRLPLGSTSPNLTVTLDLRLVESADAEPTDMEG